MNKKVFIHQESYKRMISLLLYIMIIGRDMPLPMLQQSRIISKGSPYVIRVPHELQSASSIIKFTGS
jgi:hypothetical protein